MASNSRNHGESLSQADKQDAGTSRDSTKRKQIDRAEKESSRSETRKPKHRKTTKGMPKKKRQDLLKFLECIELNVLQVEIRTAVKEQFADSHNEFIDELFN